MGWLIGIIAVIIVVYFWRIFLPLGIVAGLALGAFLLYEDHKSDQRKVEKAAAEASLKQRIATAQKNATPEGKRWHVRVEPDPASNVDIVRAAWAESNDGLCHLTVEKRINGTELTDLTCPGIEISEFADIVVKFDNRDLAQSMRLDSYTDSSDVYISSVQYEHSGHLPYGSFIEGLTSAGAVAIKIPAAGGFWVQFNLEDSGKVIGLLGKKFPIQSDK